MKKILITGANGFIGKHLCQALKSKGYFVREAIRMKNNESNALICDETVKIGDIDGDTDWTIALKNIDAIIHLANRAHILKKDLDDKEKFDTINVQGTKKLAEQAAAAGIKRFIYLSSVKVNGERTLNGRMFKETDTPAPEDDYGRSKEAAENILKKISNNAGLQYVILRPPLVYGAGVKANFKMLISLVKKGVPLPFSSIDNRRSFIYIGNLISAIIECLENPNAINQIYLVGDGHDVSTSELFAIIASLLGKKAKLFSVPKWLLQLAAGLVGQKEKMGKLTESLQIDTAKIHDQLNWWPSFTVKQGLAETLRDKI